MSWFDEKAAHLLGLPIEPSPRCGFGDGEVAVPPAEISIPANGSSGRHPDHPLRLPGHALEGGRLLSPIDARPIGGRVCRLCCPAAVQYDLPMQ